MSGPRGRLAAMVHVPRSTPAPALIMCHGFTGDRVEAHRLFVRAAREFCRRGLLVVRFDFWGSGESEGEFHEASFASEVEDLGSVLDYVAGRPDVDVRRLGVLGLSMGGAVSIFRASQDQRIRFVVSWAAPADFVTLSEYMRSLIESSRVSGEYIDLPTGFRVSIRAFQEIASYRIAEAAAKISPRPLLVVHGSKDIVVPPEHADKIFSAAGEPREKIVVEDADHTFTGYDAEWKVISLTAEWLERVVKRP
ncbi:MAG: alpha/beta hydrolase [Nitrososphaerota archaeon]|nr:alpha/beta hydrolase [Candidatus Calditenuaceae archaeon]MDW8073997.1 alpha/beta hydrolase [Nitrososphaerota archaeon]